MALAARAETARISPSHRTRVLAAARQPQTVWSTWAGASLAAAALLVTLTAPALLLQHHAGQAPQRDLNLEVSLGADGSVVLQWENGQSVHTVRKGTSARDLAKVNGIEVAGHRYQDASRSAAEIVYYQVD
jgi:hypothetical protein